jgi:hypothetical protein
LNTEERKKNIKKARGALDEQHAQKIKLIVLHFISQPSGRRKTKSE